ncbi:tRNA (adenosine(37)-N6)-threonylcarbamoyltransferase complex dimerization subunit type 1 TsaB [Bacteroidia bacterium]|jgi:tRNA threonylcarbamoyladenosine biosynthesis protein TsaB|nr:tRNA (adenosine(37)-N6)-threonylcarbamoyltransferase complex dimerization subunit type 1 TsaB [Bacteroidia bacterium]MDC0560856.1 tRNA (adenosine(37)-N6)-threonylcarbamoyltransferase complex dimerization subunit type 1 TsaB [Bacteroidia bacterium]MDC3406314.1 tRNA (adenosine(37)-N6)-threonylcarbamoyltransferase complex dimerization subunit type 1 TsaB [Bacteroidia bacterium]
MPNLLLIESSNEICSVALSQEKSIIQEKYINKPNSHSVYLAPFVNEVLNNATMSINELDGVVISDGPGSYTGLRIGSSLAKGICLGAGIPLMAVSTLKGLAQKALNDYPSVDQAIALVDARRSDAYIGVYNQQLKPIIKEQFITINSELKIEKSNAVVVGSGAMKFINELDVKKELKHSESVLYAKDLLDEAMLKWAKQDFVDLTSYEPNYIKSVFVTKPKSKF